MEKRLYWVALLLAANLTCYSQSDSTKARRSNTYLGVQANQLIRQIFNFSNANLVIDNPYLLAYSVNSKRTGVGFSAGLGYNINEVADGSPSNKRETKINNFSLRAGVEKKSLIGKKWMVSWGLDIIHDNLKNETKNIQNTDPSNPAIRFESTTTNTTSAWGFGPRFTLNFSITSRILLGTEASYYYKSGSTEVAASNTNTFLQFDPNTGGNKLTTLVTNTESSSDFARFQFIVPAVIYLTIKF